MTLSPLRTDADRFLDAHGRQVLLRGVNLGGDSKVPFPHGGTQHPDDFADHRSASFVGRPFPLAEATTHFERLRGWGFNCLRLIVTWEAIAHAGPADFDADYLRYLRALCEQAGRHGFYVFVDMHQDCWSRMSGGDGAPGWTFEAVGLDLHAFDAADAALTMQQRFDHADPNPRQAAYPQMGWHLNYRLPANGIMWSLFWAGRRLTPDFRIEGLNVQDWLQGRFLAAMTAAARELVDLPHVFGFDLLNEPGLGWLGQPLSRPLPAVLPGPVLTPLDALAVARGLSVEVPVRGRGGAHAGTRRFNAAGRTIWRGACPFEAAGIYRLREGRMEALDEQAFERLNLNEDAFAPFYAAAARALRTLRPDWLVLVQIDPFGAMAGRPLPAELPAGAVHAGHWYDLTTLATKHFDPRHSVDLLSGELAESPEALRERYVRQLARVHQASRGLPTLIGEFGIPFDLDEGLAYRQWAAGERETAFAPHTQALTLMYEALDALGLSATQWNYTAGNRNDLRIGDQWNQEDLSVYSADQALPGEPLSGGRAVQGFARPYARAVQGQILHQHFEDGVFVLEFLADPAVAAPSELVLPLAQFPAGCRIQAGGSQLSWEQPQDGLLLVRAASAGRARIECHRL